MQHSPNEIKDRLLQALDHDYNVVDMAAVFGVISILEKIIITKETLEKTRIGKYINELRKKTSDEQLARRAKELVKSWRKLLPQEAPKLVNGKETHYNTFEVEEIINQGSGNRAFKANPLVTGTDRYRTSSPSVLAELSSSPNFSSASNSPLLNSIHQGTNSSASSSYAPVKKLRTATNCVSEIYQNTRNQSNKQLLKSISPSVSKQSNSLAHNRTNESSLRTSSSVSPCLLSDSNSISSDREASIHTCFDNVSPSTDCEIIYSSFNLKKVDKHCRKEISFKNCVSSFKANGMNERAENSCESSSTKNTSSSSNSHAKELENPPKRRKSSERNELHEYRKDQLKSLPSSPKQSKVKTTQQLILEFNAKRNICTDDSLSNSVSLDPLNSVDVDVFQTKSDLLQKFLKSAEETRNENIQESLVDESCNSISNESDLGDSSVINTSSDTSYVTLNSSHIEEEINKLQASLPPIILSEIKLDDTSTSLTQRLSISEGLDKLEDKWEFVNGTYDCNGIWKTWQECSDQISMGESFKILPYVNID